jgi:gliding motility-associated-like protein/uncharacterized repeat protein (TIGR01451 family)
MIVNPNLPVSVLVGASANPVCAGTSVTYTATPTNGGTIPVYQWKVNGTNVGSNTPAYSYIPLNNDAVTVVLTSNIATCVTGNPATSNIVAMAVNPNLPVSVWVGASANPVCAGTSVTYTATPTNGGSTPVYQWKVNGTNVGSNSLTYSYIPLNNDAVTVVLTSNVVSCATGNPATSNIVAMSVNSNLPVSVLVGASANPVCAGTSVTYTATPTNGGTTPVYQWKVNGTNVGLNNPTYSYIPLNNDAITVVLTSNVGACATGSPANSNIVTMTVNPNSPVSVLIGASANPVCTGTSVNYTATPTNGGTTPVYQWKVNGTNVGSNNPTYAIIPLNNDAVTVVLTSNIISCATGNPATSNIVTMTVNPNLPVSVLVGASANPVCTGNLVTYTATPTNGGPTPVYQWKVNGTNVGSNTPAYSYIPLNNDAVTVVVTSNAGLCATGSPANSNIVIMIVNPNLPVSVLVGASANPVCAGTSVTYSATPTNGGTTPVYQWKVNGTNVGLNNSTYSYIPSNGDLVTVILTTSVSCSSGSPAISNIVGMAVNAITIPTIAGSTTACNKSVGNVFTSQAGMTNYVWTVSAGGSITAGLGTNSIIVTWNSTGYQAVGVIYTNSSNCVSNLTNFTVVVDICPADLSVVKTASNMHPLISRNLEFTIVAANSGPYDATSVIMSDIIQSGYTYVSSSATTGAFDPSASVWSIGNLSNGAFESLTITVTVKSSGDYLNTASISGFEIDENMDNNVSSVEPIPTDFFIPEGFSPNDDGINDLLVIRGIVNFPENTFTIYNRWGNKVYNASPYTDKWDGKSIYGVKVGGDKLPTGTYFYLLDLGDGSDVIKGTIYLNK